MPDVLLISVYVSECFIFLGHNLYNFHSVLTQNDLHTLGDNDKLNGKAFLRNFSKIILFILPNGRIYHF